MFAGATRGRGDNDGMEGPSKESAALAGRFVLPSRTLAAALADSGDGAALTDAAEVVASRLIAAAARPDDTASAMALALAIAIGLIGFAAGLVARIRVSSIRGVHERGGGE